MVANPIFIPIAFAANGIKNLIQKVRQVGQDPEDFTWDEGSPLITMTKIEDGGKAPKGQDFNGVLNALSEHVIYGQNGNRYTWSQDVVDEFGGYALGAIVQSNDTTKEFRSLVANNAVNPNNGLGGVWEVYSGQGSIPTATSTTAGITKVLNVLNSNDIGSALSAAQGKVLNDVLNKFTYASNLIQIPIKDRVYIIQFGSTDFIGGNNTVHTSSFGTAFPNACLHVQVGTKTNSTTGVGAQRAAQYVSHTRTNFTWYSDGFVEPGKEISANYIAIGY